MCLGWFSVCFICFNDISIADKLMNDQYSKLQGTQKSLHKLNHSHSSLNQFKDIYFSHPVVDGLKTSHGFDRLLKTRSLLILHSNLWVRQHLFWMHFIFVSLLLLLRLIVSAVWILIIKIPLKLKKGCKHKSHFIYLNK